MLALFCFICPLGFVARWVRHVKCASPWSSISTFNTCCCSYKTQLFSSLAPHLRWCHPRRNHRRRLAKAAADHTHIYFFFIYLCCYILCFSIYFKYYIYIYTYIVLLYIYRYVYTYIYIYMYMFIDFYVYFIYII